MPLGRGFWQRHLDGDFGQLIHEITKTVLRLHISERDSGKRVRHHAGEVGKGRFIFFDVSSPPVVSRKPDRNPQRAPPLSESMLSELGKRFSNSVRRAPIGQRQPMAMAPEVRFHRT
jgi:hypothetical protein